MSEFSFVATAQCSYCGQNLSDSTKACDNCTEADRDHHFFRRVGSGRLVEVEATLDHKWQALFDVVGDDWIAYQWLGERRTVRSMLQGSLWGQVSDLPHRAMATSAPDDVGE